MGGPHLGLIRSADPYLGTAPVFHQKECHFFFFFLENISDFIHVSSADPSFLTASDFDKQGG